MSVGVGNGTIRLRRSSNLLDRYNGSPSSTLSARRLSNPRSHNDADERVRMAASQARARKMAAHKQRWARHRLSRTLNAWMRTLHTLYKQERIKADATLSQVQQEAELQVQLARTESEAHTARIVATIEAETTTAVLQARSHAEREVHEAKSATERELAEARMQLENGSEVYHQRELEMSGLLEQAQEFSVHARQQHSTLEEQVTAARQSLEQAEQAHALKLQEAELNLMRQRGEGQAAQQALELEHQATLANHRTEHEAALAEQQAVIPLAVAAAVAETATRHREEEAAYADQVALEHKQAMANALEQAQAEAEAAQRSSELALAAQLAAEQEAAVATTVAEAKAAARLASKEASEAAAREVAETKRVAKVKHEQESAERTRQLRAEHAEALAALAAQHEEMQALSEARHEESLASHIKAVKARASEDTALVSERSCELERQLENTRVEAKTQVEAGVARGEARLVEAQLLHEGRRTLDAETAEAQRARLVCGRHYIHTINFRIALLSRID